jgi:hypothetical protein
VPSVIPSKNDVVDVLIIGSSASGAAWVTAAM